MGDLAFTKDKNQIGTPWHVVEFLGDLLEVDDKRVFDPTAGSGNMLARAGERYGVEFDQKAYDMLCERYPNDVENFINADIFESADFIAKVAPEVVLMNPPYNAEPTKGLKFVQFVADAVGSGRLACVVPVNCGAANGKKAIDKIRGELLERHRLDYVFKMNGELFYPTATPGVVVMIFTLGTSNAGNQTFFADLSDDGLEKVRHQGRVDVGTWSETKARWLDYCKRKPTEQQGAAETVIPCARAEVTVSDSWLPSDAVPRDPSTLMPTPEDFRKVVNDYIDFIKNDAGPYRALRGEAARLNAYMDDHPDLKPPVEQRIQTLEQRIQDMQQQLEALKQEQSAQERAVA